MAGDAEASYRGDGSVSTITRDIFGDDANNSKLLGDMDNTINNENSLFEDDELEEEQEDEQVKDEEEDENFKQYSRRGNALSQKWMARSKKGLLEDSRPATPEPPSASQKTEKSVLSRIYDIHGSFDEELEEDGAIDFLKDNKREMTMGRRIALSLMNHSWYNPLVYQQEEREEKASKAYVRASAAATLTTRPGATPAYPFFRARKGSPSLAKAWAYFEHVQLPRYVVMGADESNTQTHENRNSDDEKEQPEGGAETTTKEKTIPEEEAEDEPEAAPEPPQEASTPKPQEQALPPKQPRTSTYERAEPGEKYLRTKLYSPLWTPHRDMGDFGLGIGLYFSALRSIGIVAFLAGCVSIPNIIYFAGDEYSDKQEGVDPHVRGSAICTDTSWVPCPDCNPDDFPDERIATGTSLTDPSVTTVFALRNNCDGATFENGLFSLGVFVVMLVGVMVMNFFAKRDEVRFDEQEQTAQDYSVVIRNPPHDAWDPHEWKDYFFKQFEARATVCTIGVDNDLLLRCLVKRREALRAIEMNVDPGTSLDGLTIASLAADLERDRGVLGRLWALMFPSIPEFFATYVVTTAKIQGLAQRDHPVSNVFVTFETEQEQRRVLESLSVGKHAVNANKSRALKTPSYLFRGKVLRVTEPEEPNSIRWHDLNESSGVRMRQQFMTVTVTLGAILGVAFVVICAHTISIAISAFVISLFNTAFPMFAKFLTSFEAHKSEGGKQRSLYFKVALFRWVNTAVIITIITPFTMTLYETDGLVHQVFALFFADIVTSTLIQLADVGGQFSRHFLAPRAKNQTSMNLNMQGTELDLSERYTDMTKMLLLAVWYCVVYPATLFLCAITFLISYYVDRFSLMRSWRRSPNLGPRISSFSRQYFFSLAVVGMALLSSYYWSGFPFDNICERDGTTNKWSGTWSVDPKASDEGTSVVEVASSDVTYFFCRQDFFRYYHSERPSFPFNAENQKEGFEWMTDDQETVTDIWGWVAVGAAGSVMIFFLLIWMKAVRGYFRGDYKPCGKAQGEPYSGLETVSAYIPQVNSKAFPYPLVACQINFDASLFEWTDPDLGHSFYDLTKDAEFMLHGTDVSQKEVFSKVAHWPQPVPSEDEPSKDEPVKEIA